MGFISGLIDVVLHVDRYIGIIIQHYGVWTYLILFLIIMLETGLVITPFLPGDSLLFAAGTFAGAGMMNVFLPFGILAAAAIIGDTMNYWIGSYFGERVFAKSRLFKKEYLERTKEFYSRHGGKTIMMARFIPIIRTFAPFVAGIGKMSYFRFLLFNVMGGIIWTALFIFAGYFLGSIPFVKENLTWAILIIIFASFIPPLFEFLRHKLKKKADA